MAAARGGGRRRADAPGHAAAATDPLTTLTLPADLPLVPLDSVLIEQVLINLLENAIKYTPRRQPDRRSRRTATRDAITIEIADRGPGLPPGDEQRVFDKFYRAPVTKDRSGVGLGLTICRGIIAAHNGRIWAENRPGGGAVFRFTLPLDGTPPQIAPEVLTASNQPLPASD